MTMIHTRTTDPKPVPTAESLIQTRRRRAISKIGAVRRSRAPSQHQVLTLAEAVDAALASCRDSAPPPNANTAYERGYLAALEAVERDILNAL